MSITERAMVVNCRIGMWMGHRLDKEVTKKLTEEANAEADTARVNKLIIPKDALKPLVSAQSTIRSHVYANTLPWKDNGDRVLPRLNYQKFIEQHQALHAKFCEAVNHLLTVDYPTARAKAEFRMGELFKAEDYPTPESLRAKFYVALDIEPIAVASDFRVEMDGDEQDRIKASIEEATTQRLGRAMQDAWRRLAEPLENFAERMGNADAKFKDATINNLEEIIEALPALNILDDPDLETMRLRIKSRLGGLAPSDLRKDENLRKMVAKDAQDIMNDMAGFMRAFGGNS